ncbi:aldo/keto reductase [Hellea balneolensis]|uniref:aldo/keto reductase n=1 Tax=Hellea balneolensis TaxID=287478 RepID=UPI0003F55F96|nr:aldo/keto reductase [Hellea balneolensis]
MKQTLLGSSKINVGAIGYGCWRFAESSLQEADRKIRTALDSGMTLIDTADIYGLGEARGFGGAEEVLGNVLQASPDLRGRMILATKGGIDAVRPYDTTYDYLMTAIDNSLARLKTSAVDLYQIHRPDITTHMAETARALNDIVLAGKARYIGVSNFTVSQTRALQAHLDTKIITTQPEFSALQQAPLIDGTLDWCQEMTATALAWSPLAGGRLFSENNPITETLDRLAEKHNATRTHIALAFTTHHGADVIPIIGTQKTERIIDSAKAGDIPLTARDFYDIVEAYRGEAMP